MQIVIRVFVRFFAERFFNEAALTASLSSFIGISIPAIYPFTY